MVTSTWVVTKITNLGKGTDDSDAVNLKQLKDSRTIVKSTDGTVGVRESESTDGAKVYDLSTGASPRFDELTDEIGRVGAQGAALASIETYPIRSIRTNSNHGWLW